MCYLKNKWWRHQNAGIEQDNRLAPRGGRGQEEDYEAGTESLRKVFKECKKGSTFGEESGLRGYAEECCQEAPDTGTRISCEECDKLEGGESSESCQEEEKEVEFKWNPFKPVTIDREAIRSERVNALRYQPLKRAEIANRRARMKAAAASRVMSINMWAKLMYPNSFFTTLMCKRDMNSPEWHRAEADRLEFERNTKAKIAKAKKLRNEDANYDGLFSAFDRPHEFMAGPSGRLPK